MERVEFDTPEEIDEEYWTVYISNNEIETVWKENTSQEVPLKTYLPYKEEILEKALK